MDWRSGKPNATGSAFRGISSRGRGRGRGRGAAPSGRGAEPVTPTFAPPTPVAQESTTSISSQPKPSSRRGSHHHPRRAPSLSHLDLSKVSTAIPEQPSALTGPPSIARRASHNLLGSDNEPNVSRLQDPSIKLEPSTPTTPAAQRPKPTRKRSQNRTRSSSKGSTHDRLSATVSIASLKDRDKDTPPHLAVASAPPGVQSFDLRTNIDSLVERVRAMAMAGSMADKDKDREGPNIPHEGHIDWAGDDDDDTLPDLDDWVRPKSVEPKEVDKTEGDLVSDKPLLSPVKETSPELPVFIKEKEKEGKVASSDDVKQDGKSHWTEKAKDVRALKSTDGIHPGKEKEPTSARSKTRGKHSRKKGSISEPLCVEVNTTSRPVKPSTLESVPNVIKDSSALSIPKTRLPLVHPLPPKPQLTSPVRGPKSRGPQIATPIIHQMPRSPEGTLGTTLPPDLPLSGDRLPALSPPIEVPEPSTHTENSGTLSQSLKKKPSIDWAKAPRPSDIQVTETAPEIKDGTDFSTAKAEPESRKRILDPNVDWANAPRLTPDSSPSRRSPTRGNPSFISAHSFSSPSHPQTAPPHGHPRGLFHPSQTGSPPVFPDVTIDSPYPVKIRSQFSSPESSPRRWLNREGGAHIRSHSSPQTGPGTRTHASRPVITLDAISRISRTLGVPGTTTPPHGHPVGVSVNE